MKRITTLLALFCLMMLPLQAQQPAPVQIPDYTVNLKDGSIKPGISASKRHDVSISGEGILDGNGGFWRPVKRGKVSDVEWKEYLKKGGEVTEDGSLWYAYNLKGYENIGPDARTQTFLPDFQDIVMERITVWGAATGIRAKGNLQMIHDITVKDAVLYVRKATDIDDDRMIALENVRLIEFAEKKTAFAE